MKDFYSPNDFIEGSDSARIQAAIDAASNEGCNCVVIPKCNQKSNTYRWVIDHTILLPSDMTLILDNCYLIMADGVMCRMFQTKYTETENGNSLLYEHKNIHIIGRGTATLDGGNDNGLNEFTSQKNGFPLITHNLLIFFHNIRGFVIDNLTIRNQRWWAIEFLFASEGQIRNIHFELDNIDSTATWRNQDGIDLRVGCHDILIENISGETGDDSIALTALMRPGSHEFDLWVREKESDIHDVVIRNIRCRSHMCAIIRLLNQCGHKIYNITMDTIIDASRTGITPKTQKVLRLGEDSYYQNHAQRAKPGDMYNIFINNIHSRALSAIHLEMAVKNLHASNIYVHHDGQYAVTFGVLNVTQKIKMFEPKNWEQERHQTLSPSDETWAASHNEWEEDNRNNANLPGLYAENILIEHIYYTAEQNTEKFTPTLFAFYNTECKNVVLKNIHADETVRLIECFDADLPQGVTIEP